MYRPRTVILWSAALAAFLLAQPAAVTGGDGVEVATFATSVEDQIPAVKHNISLAAARLDGIEIAPGATISFNGIVGEGSPENGYVSGQVLYRDGVRMEPGGGICQVSSTLYNALLMAGMVIVERHRHFQPVTYVPPGLDATIKFGKKDLQVRNPHDQKLRITVEMNDRTLAVRISGEKKLTYSYLMDTEEETMQLPLQEENPDIRHGIMVHVYRVRFRDGKRVDASLLYRDFYPPVSSR